MSTVQEFENFPIPTKDEEMTSILKRKWQEFNATMVQATTEVTATTVGPTMGETTTFIPTTTANNIMETATSTWVTTHKAMGTIATENSKSKVLIEKKTK